MSTPGDLRRIALGFPEAYEDTHRRRPAFRVNKRLFAMLGVIGNDSLFPGLAAEGTAVIKLPREDQLNMAAAYDGAVRPAESYGHHGWTYLDLPALDEASLTMLLRMAWAEVAPKRLSRGG